MVGGHMQLKLVDNIPNVLNFYSVITQQELCTKALQEFANSKPKWPDVVMLAKKAVDHFVPYYPDLQEADKKEPEARDEQLENNMGFNIYSTLYEEFSYAMDHGDIS